jgi:hypothetical protein
MIVLIISILLVSLALGINTIARKNLGLNKAISDIRINRRYWVAETKWIDKLTGQENCIITKNDLFDGIISIFNGEHTIYHTKQPFHDPRKFKSFHFNARTRFFYQLMFRMFRNKQSLRKVILINRAFSKS